MVQFELAGAVPLDTHIEQQVGDFGGSEQLTRCRTGAENHVHFGIEHDARCPSRRP